MFCHVRVDFCGRTIRINLTVIDSDSVGVSEVLVRGSNSAGHVLCATDRLCQARIAQVLVHLRTGGTMNYKQLLTSECCQR